MFIEGIASTATTPEFNFAQVRIYQEEIPKCKNNKVSGEGNGVNQNGISKVQPLEGDKNSNLQGMDYSFGGAAVYGGKLGMQQLTSGVKNYLIIYASGGTDVGSVGIKGSIGIVKYFTDDIEDVKEAVIDIGGGINAPVASGEYSRVYKLNDPNPVGEVINAGPAAKTPGPSMHVMGTVTLIVFEADIFDPDKYANRRKPKPHKR